MRRMSLVLTSDDLAVWLRFQIAAGRLTDVSDAPAMTALARKFDVTLATVSAAYDQLGEANDDMGFGCDASRFGSGFGVVADLVDQIVALDCPDTENPSEF